MEAQSSGAELWEYLQLLQEQDLQNPVDANLGGSGGFSGPYAANVAVVSDNTADQSQAQPPQAFMETIPTGNINGWLPQVRRQLVLKHICTLSTRTVSLLHTAPHQRYSGSYLNPILHS